MIGNMYGLPHENIYIDEPGPSDFPYGYDYREVPFYPFHFGTGLMTGVMNAMGGAFSDDDTDIEYIYLNVMEERGVEPSYADLRAAWTYHIRDWVWLANRAALGLMVQGYSPPATGAKTNNVHWFQIDGQLINEIWALTAPGMVDYAAAKSAWAARITNDDWAIEPTIHYGAMYSAAFFENDIGKVIDIATAALPEGSRFAQTVAHMKRLHTKYPNDWTKARREMADAYYHNAEHKTIWNANLNGAAAILALLYGNGDVQKTLDLACVLGFDADNQAASMIGLLGVIKGRSGLPKDLLMPLEDWREPFNDRYINRSRFDLPNESIKRLAARSVAIAEQIILKNGGSKREDDGETVYEVNPNATFTSPFELAAEPTRHFTAGELVDVSYHSGGSDPEWSIVKGALPPGISFDAGALLGGPTKVGNYDVTLQVENEGQTIKQTFAFVVRGENLAATAQNILAPETDKETDREILRDAQTMNTASYQSVGRSAARLVFFGYEWSEPQDIGSIEITMGDMTDDGGWFMSMSAELLTEDGRWVPVSNLAVSPEPSFENNPFAHPPYATYILSFDGVNTKSVRLNGLTGGSKRHVSVSEVGVYPPTTN